MRALYVRKPGQVPDLEVREVETPTPGAGEVLVKVDSAGLCGHDIAIMTGLLRRGVDHSVILGHEISGRIAGIGKGVSGISEGDGGRRLADRFLRTVRPVYVGAGLSLPIRARCRAREEWRIRRVCRSPGAFGYTDSGWS